MFVSTRGELRQGFTVTQPVSPIPNAFRVRPLPTSVLAACLAGVVMAAALSGEPAAADTPLPPQIHTVAGGGSCSGAVTRFGKCDVVPATSVPILGARSVAELPSGGFAYIDWGNRLVREVSVTGIVRTVAGMSTPSAFNNVLSPSSTDVDCVPGTQSGLDDPAAVAALPNGGLLITEFNGGRVRMLSPNGMITTIAGTPPTDSVQTSQDNPAGSATLVVPSTVGFPSSGTLIAAGQTLTYTSLAPTQTAFVLSQPTGADVPSQSTVELSSAVGCPEYSVPPGTAPWTPLTEPSDAVATATGGVLIANTYADEVLLLQSWANPGATMQVIAGGPAATCNDGSSQCDGLNASQVRLDLPDAISEIGDGSNGYLVSEAAADAVRKVSLESPSGILTTVAGVPGLGGYSGDGGPAVTAQLSQPRDVVALEGGGFLIADTGNNLVREVSPAGVISTIAGEPQLLGYTGDGGAATSAELNGPSALALAPQNGVLIADSDNGAIREITQPPVSTIEFMPRKPNGKHGWYTKPPSIALATTAINTVTACVVDPGQAPPVFAAFAPGCRFARGFAKFTRNGVHTIYAASENPFGDQQNVMKVNFKIDTTRPKLTCRHEPSFKLHQRKAKVLATLKDTISGPASAKVAASANTKRPGRHTVKVRGVSVAGLSGKVVCPYFVRRH
jgi:hypothetical protein